MVSLLLGILHYDNRANKHAQQTVKRCRAQRRPTAITTEILLTTLRRDALAVVGPAQILILYP